MPAILRKSLPKLFASITIIRPYAQNEQSVGSGGPDRPPCGPRQRHVGLQHYEVLSVCLSIGAGHLRLRLLSFEGVPEV
jgi:hypothetical protein